MSVYCYKGPSEYLFDKTASEHVVYCIFTHRLFSNVMNMILLEKYYQKIDSKRCEVGYEQIF